MNLKFYGAAECVTGSCHILRVNNKLILLDCGLFQGKDESDRGNDSFEFDPKEVDYILLSHAHIDHSGRIPLMYKRGFKGKVICTEATKDLCAVMLPDSGHIQEMESEWKTRKRQRQGLTGIEPLYTAKIAELSMYLFDGYDYGKWVEVFPGFNVRFHDAGHLLGSAIIEMKIIENEKETILVYTGDLGNKNIPIIRNPETLDYADYLIMETTYGDRIHENIEMELEQLVDIIKDTFKRGGNVIIPSFAVGRTQEVIYALNQYVDSDKLKSIKVYVDSPLAKESTDVFEDYRKYYDEDAQKYLKAGNDPLNFDGLIFTSSPAESAQINKINSGIIVISASGMCDAGRIRHHLKHNLWRKESSIVFVGYQAEGTLGRSILDGAKKVKIFGEEIAVNAKIYNLPGLSGHADRNGLLEWLECFRKRPKEVMLVHGNETSQRSFLSLIQSKGYNSKIMKVNEKFYLNEEIEENLNRKQRIINVLNNLDDLETMDEATLIENIKKSL